MAHLPEGVTHRQVDRGLLVDLDLGGRYTHHAEVGPDGDSDVREYTPMLLYLAVVHRDTRIVDRRMHHTKRIRLWYPAEVIERSGPVARAGGIHFIDGDDLPRLG